MIVTMGHASAIVSTGIRWTSNFPAPFFVLIIKPVRCLALAFKRSYRVDTLGPFATNVGLFVAFVDVNAGFVEKLVA